MLASLKTNISYERLHETDHILDMMRARGDNITLSEINERILSEKEKAALNQTDAEYELLNIDAAYMALVRKLGL
jgi:hypothetical protein